MGLLDGELASLVSSALVGAGMAKDAVLTRVTAGQRTPGAVTAGNNPTTTSLPVRALPADTAQFRHADTLIAGVDRAIKIFGASLPAGVVPVPGDRITMDGATSTIVGDDGGKRAVTVDPVGAMYTCQCRS
jgi:hypothetical protein